jgi:hypothetical protein
MLSLPDAARIAAEATGRVVAPEGARELPSGWYLPYGPAPTPLLGSNGVIVNKRTWRPFLLGSAFPVERDLALYERGYQFDAYDLVVLEVASRRSAVQALMKLGFATIDPEYSNGAVWRIPKPVSPKDIEARLSKLPAVFGGVSLYFVAEHLERSREAGVLKVELCEYPVALQPRAAADGASPAAYRA